MDENGNLDFFELRTEDYSIDTKVWPEVELIFVSDDIDYEKSNREKVVDRIYYGDLHSGYTRRYRNDYGKTNLKTLLSCKSKSKSERFFRKVTNKVKFFGMLFDCFNEVDILDTIGGE